MVLLYLKNMLLRLYSPCSYVYDSVSLPISGPAGVSVCLNYLHSEADNYQDISKKPEETLKKFLFACMLHMEITHHLIVNRILIFIISQISELP
jgi:hypothetical protein